MTNEELNKPMVLQMRECVIQSPAASDATEMVDLVAMETPIPAMSSCCCRSPYKISLTYSSAFPALMRVIATRVAILHLLITAKATTTTTERNTAIRRIVM